MKWGAITLVTFLFLAFGLWAIVASKSKPSAPVELSKSGQSTSTNSATLTLVEFGDFQCPACKAYENATQQVRKAYKDDVNFVFKHFPLKSAHPNALPAAIAAEAAANQGKFWEFHDLLYEKQKEWSGLPDASEKLIEYASSLDLDTEKFSKDLKDKKLESIINAQLDEGIRAGVNSTPTFFLNGLMIEPNQDFDSFKKLIDEALSSKK